MAKTVVVSVNSSWNLLNFRSELLCRLVEQGWRVVALTPNDEHAGRLHEIGVTHVTLAIDSKGISPLGDALLLARYWSALRRIRPDVFLGWTIKPNVYGSMAAHALGIPVINNVSGLGTVFIKQNWLTATASALYRVAFTRSSTVFFQNSVDRDLFVRRGLLKRGQTMLLPGSGINTKRFRPVQADGRSRPFTFLMIARLIRDKGIHEYCDAAAIIRKERGDVRFAVVGPVDVENRTAVTQTQLDRWLVEGTIVHHGETDDVRPFIADADCVVLPSYREGMPRSLLEAAAMGKPLVATDVPGCTEIARAGENAILCRACDARSLADAMLAMLDLPPAVRLAMAQRSRGIAEGEFDIAIVKERYLDAIERATGAAMLA